MLRHLLPWCLCALSLPVAAALYLETRRLAVELEAVGATGRQQELDRLATVRRVQELEQETRQLTGQLQAAQEQQQAMGAALQARVAQEAADREARAAQATADRQPMPEGVRLALLALQDCARIDGFPGLRFLAARRLDGQALHGVEVLDSDPAQLHSSFYLADRLHCELDRATGALVLRFFDGQWRRDGKVEPLPADGLPLTLRPVTGPLWEERLPFLVRASGDYPTAGNQGRPRDPDELPAEDRIAWQQRLNDLLAAATTPLRLQVGSLRGLREARFRGVGLQGYDRGKCLQLAASCQSLAVEVDDHAGIVQLLLAEGTLRGAGGDSTISAEGYRMLLEGITPQRASTAMLGMVVRR